MKFMGTLANARPTFKPKSFVNQTRTQSQKRQKYAIICVFTNTARVVKLVDSGDSKSPAARRAGSSPAPGTTLKIKHLAVLDFFLPAAIGAKIGAP